MALFWLLRFFCPLWISAKQMEILELDTTIKFCLHACLAVVSLKRN